MAERPRRVAERRRLASVRWFARMEVTNEDGIRRGHRVDRGRGDRAGVIDVGPIEATRETREAIPLPPILGALALAGGVVLLVVGARRKS